MFLRCFLPVLASLFVLLGGRQVFSLAPDNMISLTGGVFSRGCPDCGNEDALPVHKVELNGFWIDATAVTNADYETFVHATHYKTVAERPLRSEDFPGVPKEKLVPGSAVFFPPKNVSSLHNPYVWWRYVPGANWAHPEGPGSDTKARLNHPVVHIAYEDAETFCRWRGKRLPTEAEFEYAARGGLHLKRYAWGDELKPKGKWVANIWQGTFPTENTAEDGYTRTSPVKAFPANGFGLYDMAGNVWQWTSDWYRADTYSPLASKGEPVKNPHGPFDSLDPNEPGVKKRVQRGGSFLCSAHYCTRYLVGSRGKGAVDSGSSNVGFRCVKDK